MCRLCKGAPNVPTELDPMWDPMWVPVGPELTLTLDDVLRLEGADPIRHTPPAQLDELGHDTIAERFYVGVLARRFLRHRGAERPLHHDPITRGPDGSIPEAELERLRRQAEARHGMAGITWSLTGPRRAMLQPAQNLDREGGTP